MIQLETLSGQPYDKIYLNETDFKYSDIQNHIMKNIKRPYPEYNPSKFTSLTMYIKTDIKLFNKGQLIDFDDDISFDKEDSVLQIFIKYKYMFIDYFYKINNFTEENRYEKIVDLIKINGRFLNLLRDDEQTEELCKLAVHKHWSAFQYVRNQTEELCKFAIQKDGYALQYVKNQTEEICKLAVQQDGDALEFVENQTEELCKLAIQQDGYALEFVENQTEELCKLAVQQNCLALEYVKNQTEEICKLAVQQNCFALKYVRNQTEELCKLAVQKNPCALEYVPEHMKHLFM